MSIDQILIITFTLLPIAAALWWLPNGKVKVLFIIMLLAMASYKFIDIESEEGMVMWARHGVVMAGEVIFYWFLVSYGKRFIETEDPRHATKSSLPAVLLPMGVLGSESHSSSYEVGAYVTDQGLPHILVLPFFVLFVALVRLRYGLYHSRYNQPLMIFLYAAGAWTMMHVSEFLLESQAVLSSLAEHVEDIELLFFVVGSIVFIAGLWKFNQIHQDTHAPAQQDVA